MRALRFVSPLVVLIALWSMSASAQVVEFPPSWQGIWNENVVMKDCETGTVLGSYAQLDTICPGNSIGDTGDVCTGTITDTAIDVTCSWSEEVFPGCTVSFQSVTTGTKSGNSISGSTETSTSYTAGCGLPDTCIREEITGTFVSVADEAACPSVATPPASWGVLKSRY